MSWYASSYKGRLALHGLKSHQAALSTSTQRAAKARPISASTIALAAIQRMIFRKRSKIEWAQPRSVLHGVHGHINGTAIFASAASETSINVISRAFAHECGLKISPSPSTSTECLVLPSGQNAETIGIASAEWTFKGEMFSKIGINFIVLESSSRPVILGADILQRTRTFDLNWHRIQTTSVPAENFSCVHILGDLSNSIAGRLDSIYLSALAATGSEVNLVSMRFIEDSGLKSDLRTPLEEHWVKLVDGSYIPIDRTVVLNWQYGDESKHWPAEFVVVSDLPCDVVLGQQFLYGSGVFFRYTDCFRARRPTTIRSGIGAAPVLLRGFLPAFAASRSRSSQYHQYLRNIPSLVIL
jgi:hypothetical protein